ncbi:MAG: hypothetical protein JWP69_1588 [Flaviaesturariibacter sp.]|nr:hypothetical protein [Flaviaesturariibacter sp.]
MKKLSFDLSFCISFHCLSNQITKGGAHYNYDSHHCVAGAGGVGNNGGEHGEKKCANSGGVGALPGWYGGGLLVLVSGTFAAFWHICFFVRVSY